MSVAQIILGGVVVNVIAADPAATVSSDGLKLIGPTGEWCAPEGATIKMQPGAGIGWTEGPGGVLVAPVVAAPAPTQAQLQAYAAARADALAAALRPISADGVAIKSTSTDAAVGKLNALAAWGAANPSATTIWTADDFSTVTVTGAQIAAVAPLALAYSMAVYGAALPAVLADIAAGAITTFAGVDAYAWPA